MLLTPSHPQAKSVLVVERGQYAGAKNMTGGRIYTHSLATGFPRTTTKHRLQRKVDSRAHFAHGSPDSNFTVDYAASRELTEQGQESWTVLRAPV